MAVRTSSQSGNTNIAPFAFGSVVNAGDRLVVSAAHAVAVDGSIRIGDYRPVRPVTVPTGASVAGGGSLATATYRIAYTNVDSGGGESAISPESSTVSITVGATLRVTLPALPTGATSRNVYLTTGAAGTGKLYKTGTTGTTVDCTSASWTDGTTTEAGAVAFPNGFAITVTATGSLTVNSGVTLTVAGDSLTGANITLAGTAIWEFDASGSVSPSNTPYACFQGTANSGQTGIKIQTSGTALGTRATVRSTAGGANGYFRANVGAGAVGNFVDTSNWAVSYVDFVRVGGTALDAISIAPSVASNVQTFTGCTFDANSGALAWSGNPPTTAGWTVVSCVFNQTNPRAISGSGNPNPFAPRAATTTPTASRLTQLCSFTKPPYKRGNGSTWDRNVYYNGWDGASDTNPWTSADGEFLRFDFATGQTQGTNGSQTNTYCLFDPTKVSQETGTATAGANSTNTGTLTDTAKTWTVNQYQSVSGTNTYAINITSGSGSGQWRRIKSNTATVLTTDPPWTVAPDATSHYQIWLDGNNPHYLNAASASGSSFSHDGCIFDGNTVDHDGDGVKSFGQAGATYSVQNCIVLPNLTGVDNSCTLITMFANTPSTTRVNANHNTVCCGNQSGLQISEGGSNQPAGTLLSAKSNNFWNPLPASNYINGGIESYKIADSTNAANPALSLADSYAPANADYNNGFQLHTAGFAGNGHNTNESSTPGTHDFAVDPKMVAPTRNAASWDASLGGAGTYASAVTRLLADPTLITTLLVHVRAGAAPRNTALRNAGHDGATIGAVEGQFGSMIFKRRRAVL